MTSYRQRIFETMTSPLKIEDVVAMVKPGSVLMVGGFMGVGAPHRMLEALTDAGVNDLTIIANDASLPGKAIGKLLDKNLVSRLIVSHIGLNPLAQKQMNEGQIKCDLIPQGTLAERIRCAGFGLGGALTATGVGTVVEEGKQTVEVNGKTYLVEEPLHADFALIHAHRADYVGNLTYTLTAQNFNPIMTMAATTVIAEADEIVPLGVIPPDEVRTPGPLVDYILERAH